MKRPQMIAAFVCIKAAKELSVGNAFLYGLDIKVKEAQHQKHILQ